jgi:hypothetical protein
MPEQVTPELKVTQGILAVMEIQAVKVIPAIREIKVAKDLRVTLVQAATKAVPGG